MKSKYNRLSRLSQIVLAVATTGALMSSAYATTYTWANAGVVGTNYNPDAWNTPAHNATNWDTNGVPSNDGTADVVFSLSHNGWPNYTVNPTSLTPSTHNWSIDGITFINSGNSADWGATYLYGPGGYGSSTDSLSIGAGGITNNQLSSPEIGIPIIATASQPWNINNMAGNFTGGLTIKGNLTINNGVIISKNVATTGPSTAPTSWFSGGGWYLPTVVGFYNGTTTTVGTGAFTLTGGGFLFSGVSQYGRLGTNPLAWTMDASIRKDTSLSFQDTTSGSFTNSVVFTAGYGSVAGISYGNGSTDAGTTLTLTGTLSGDLRGGWTNDRGFINVQTISSNYNVDDRNKLIIQGNNTSLVSDHPTDWTYGIVHVPQGAVVLDNANAIGTGNKLSVFLGNNANEVTNNFAALLATNGNNVSAHVNVRGVDNGGDQHKTSSEVGLSGTGSVTYSGDFQFATTSWTMSAGPNGEGPNLPKLKLTAPAGGTAIFTGNFVPGYSGDPYQAPITILGGGTVELAVNNTTKGAISVRGGTLVLGGSHTPTGVGTSNISLGDTVVAPSGGDVAAATTNGQLPVSGYSAGVLTFSSAVSTLDGVSLSAGNRVLLKDIQWNPEWTGVYTVTDSTHWTRSSDLNTTSAFATGLRVHVAYGTLNGGKNYYLPTGLWTGAVLGDSSGSSTSAKFLFNPDAPSNTDVAILLDGSGGTNYLSRNVDVTNNLSTGNSILGGATTGDTYFLGNVTLAKDAVLTAVPSGYTEFDGNISGSHNVTISGGGTVDYWNNQVSNTGSTTVVAGSTLEVDGDGTTDFVVSSPITVNGTLTGYQGYISSTVNVTSTGTLAPGGTVYEGTDGLTTTINAGATTLAGHYTVKVDDLGNDKLISSSTINISGAHVDVSVLGGGFTQPYYVIATGTSITGTAAAVTTGYALTNTGTELRLSLAPSNSFDNWMSTYHPTITGSDALPTANPSHDGIINLVKYALDLNPSASSQPAGTHSGNTLTFTKGTMAKADSNLTYSIQESTDLATWTAPTLGSVSYGDTITYTYPTSGTTKVFARLKVVQTP